MRLRKRGGVWYARFWENGIRVSKSTQCTNRDAAKKVGDRWEAEAADPNNAATRRATLNDAFTLLLEDREEQARAKRRSEATVRFYRQKAGHWLRILGHDFLLTEMSPKPVRRFVSRRRAEFADGAKTRNVTDHTISKELVALRAALKLAVADGIWKGDPKAVVPVSFAPEYSPRERALTEDELVSLFRALDRHEAARTAFIVATSAEWAATERAERHDVTNESARLRGTKRKTRDRYVPLVTDWQKWLMAYSLKHARKSGKLFEPWPSVHQSLRWACKRANIEYCTPNDLRRTFSQWMRRDRVPLELIAPMMGHATTAMLQRVYGRLDAETLAARVSASVAWPTSGPQPGPEMTSVTSVDQPKKAVNSDVDSTTSVSGSCGERSHDQRIKSPLYLLPEPGKKKRERGVSTVGGPPVAHPVRSRGGK